MGQMGRMSQARGAHSQPVPLFATSVIVFYAFTEEQIMTTTQKPPSSPAPRQNTRRSRRQPPKGSTKFRAFRNAMGLGPNIAVSILDVSETGIRLVLKEELRQQTEFMIEFEPVGARPIKVAARVVWTLPLADGNTCVGAAFAKNLAYADLLALART